MGITDAILLILLGALTGGLLTYQFSKYRLSRENLIPPKERLRRELHEVAKHVETSFHLSMKFWELLAARSRKLKQDVALTHEEDSRLLIARSALLDAMNVHPTDEMELRLVGEQEILALFREYAQRLFKFYASAHTGKYAPPVAELEKIRLDLIAARESLFKKLSTTYQHLH